MQERITLRYIESLKNAEEMVAVESDLVQKINTAYHAVKNTDQLWHSRVFLSLMNRWSILKYKLSEQGLTYNGKPYNKVTMGDILDYQNK